MDEKKILAKLREICMALPKTSETVTFGHPTFQVGTKTFSVLETYKGELSICVKVGKKMQPVFLEDQRFYRTPYVGQHGWVSLRANTRLNWKEIGELIRGSYELVSAKKKRKGQGTESAARRDGSSGSMALHAHGSTSTRRR